ncbi:unnamed protein product [Pedinophyceae sp. YPF-701]|nr:unnamed protein product [Pedinophyceae sp. YPF-701]
MVATGGAGPATMDPSIMPDDDDLVYEAEVLRNPYTLRSWTKYLNERKDIPVKRRYVIYERALRALPGSYKLWRAYLGERLEAVRALPIDSPAWDALCNTFERALVTMHKMPRIWMEYLAVLTGLRKVTKARRCFDRALSALPVTQHDRIWVEYLKFVRIPGIPRETAKRIYRRYIKLEPGHAEEYVEFLKKHEEWDEAARKIAELVNDDDFRSILGKTKHQMWLELCDIITKHPQDIKGLDVEAILRGGIRRFTDEVGRLWCALADFFIQRGLFEYARDVYEEAMCAVSTVRDFSLVFDALTQFEESMVTARMEQLGDDAQDEAPEGSGAGDVERMRRFVLEDDGNDIDLRIARLELLMERRPELLSSVMLRQNPHNVAEWHKRAKIFSDRPAKQIQAYTEALRTVEAAKALGKPHTLWVAFATFYEKNGDVDNARVIFEKATQAELLYADDYASVWCEWAEMELRANNFVGALEVLRRATTEPPEYEDAARAAAGKHSLPVRLRVWRQVRIWNMLVDLEESLGTLESTKAVYRRMLTLRVATPQTVLNFALLLTENKYWEEAFQAYERGTAMFRYPHVKDIWLAYLQLFVDRYGGSKLERARDLFEQAVEAAPRPERRALYLMYASLEEKHGMARRAMAVYERALREVPRDQKMAVLEQYAARSSEMFGVGKVREVYEAAIEAEGDAALADKDVLDVCTRYAGLERRLGEIDRARAVYVHGSQLADPRRDKAFWQEWNDFEVKHGNEDTFREMLRIKRSVSAAFAAIHFNTTNVEAAAVAAVEEESLKRKRDDVMGALEQHAAAAASQPAPGTSLPGFVSAGVVGNTAKDAEAGAAPDNAGAGAGAGANPESIDIDDVEEEEDVDIAQKAVPDAVFGGLAKKQKT